MKTPDMTISGIRLRGHQALFDALGAVGFIRFMQQFVTRGDYTKERRKWIGEIDLSDFKILDKKSAISRGREPR